MQSVQQVLIRRLRYDIAGSCSGSRSFVRDCHYEPQLDPDLDPWFKNPLPVELDCTIL